MAYRVAGKEHEFQALYRAGESQAADDDHHQHNGQGGHSHTVKPFNAPLDAPLDDEVAQNQVQEGKHQRAKLVGEHPSEKLLPCGRMAVKAQIRQIQAHILNAVAPQNRVEPQNQQGGEYRQPADPAEAPAQLVVGPHHAQARLSADGQLADHHGDAYQHRQNQVDDQVHRSAGPAHLVGEGPDVAQTHRGAHSSHQKAQVAAPGFSLFTHLVLLFSEARNRPQAPFFSFCSASRGKNLLV